MKIVLLFLLFGVLFGTCRFQEKKDIKFLCEASGLKIPDVISDIDYRYMRNEDFNYPYDFYSRFKCDSETFLNVRKQMFVGDRPEINDNNLYISSKMLINDKIYLYAFNKISWWDVKNTVKPDRLYVNYFEDRGKKRIGDSTRFNGKIAIYYNEPYCYLYILCYPPK